MTWRNEQTAAVWGRIILTRGVYENWRDAAERWKHAKPYERVREPRAILADVLAERWAPVLGKGSRLVDWPAIADRLLDEV